MDAIPDLNTATAIAASGQSKAAAAGSEPLNPLEQS